MDIARHKTVCILVPAFNEEPVLPALYRRLAAVADLCSPHADGYDFTFLFIDDGSTDGTLDLIKDISAGDRRVAWVSLSRNFGKEAAMSAGFDYADADATIIIDADLQDPPELISEMLAAWEEGYEDVYARRRSRAGETWFKKLTSKVFYALLQHTTRVRLQTDTGDFRLLDRRCVEALRRFREQERYTKGMFSLIGFKKKAILYDRDARIAGQTKWNYGGLLDLAIDGITSFTTAPLRIATLLGTLVATAGFIHLIVLAVLAIFFDDPIDEVESGIATVILIGGVQLLSLGVIGEYLARVFIETKQRPLYLAKEFMLPEPSTRPGHPTTSDDEGAATSREHPAAWPQDSGHPPMKPRRCG